MNPSPRWFVPVQFTFCRLNFQDGFVWKHCSLSLTQKNTTAVLVAILMISSSITSRGTRFSKTFWKFEGKSPCLLHTSFVLYFDENRGHHSHSRWAEQNKTDSRYRVGKGFDRKLTNLYSYVNKHLKQLNLSDTTASFRRRTSIIYTIIKTISVKIEAVNITVYRSLNDLYY